jgi:VWFA-related protein
MGLRVLTCMMVVLSISQLVCGAVARKASFAFPDSPPSSSPPQPEPAPAEAGAWASASDALGLIRLDVTVHDEKGDPVPGLAPADFTLLENHKPDKILSFGAFDGVSKTTEPPVELILLLDTISLSSSQQSTMQRETAKFLRQNGGHLARPVSFFWLTSSGLWIPPQTQPSLDGNGLAAALEHSGKLQSVWSATNDSTFLNYLPLRAVGLISAAQRQKPGRKILVWIGPNQTMGAGSVENLFFTIVWFSTLLREARIALYSLSVEPTGDYTQAPEIYPSHVKGVTEARRAMLLDLDRKVLAVQSGGRVFHPSLDLAGQIDSCVADAAAWYVLRFDPQSAERPDEYHDLQVVVGKAGLTASTNTGFYDQPYYEDRPAVASKRVSVEQLAAWLTAAHGSSDAELAKQLSDMELTERLSSAKLVSLQAGLRGNKVRQALIALADASAFLDPPANEVPAQAPPDAAAQRDIQAKVVAYLTKTIPKLPNFFATRSTVFYTETAAQYMQAGEPGVGYQPLHVTEVSKARILLRDGKEVAEPTKGKKAEQSDNNLTVYGTFGPILGTVILDSAASSGLLWSHWEQGVNGPLATFHFAVPLEKSHYAVTTCCLPDGDGTIAFHKLVGYHGEIGIDPVTGSIFRLALVADLKTAVPVTRSDVMVEYGPVRLGPNLYFLPVRSVSIIRGRTVRLVQSWNAGFRTFRPFVTKLTDATFEEYHGFGAESHMLPDYTPVPE